MLHHCGPERVYDGHREERRADAEPRRHLEILADGGVVFGAHRAPNLSGDRGPHHRDSLVIQYL